jgi:beta-aspartyl-peptidase (threonine type)
MDGKTLKAGAVASLKHVRNPSALRDWSWKVAARYARREGAEDFAKKMGMKLVDPKYFLHRRTLAGSAKGKAAPSR